MASLEPLHEIQEAESFTFSVPRLDLSPVFQMYIAAPL